MFRAALLLLLALVGLTVAQDIEYTITGSATQALGAQGFYTVTITNDTATSLSCSIAGGGSFYVNSAAATTTTVTLAYPLGIQARSVNVFYTPSDFNGQVSISCVGLGEAFNITTSGGQLGLADTSASASIAKGAYSDLYFLSSSSIQPNGDITVFMNILSDNLVFQSTNAKTKTVSLTYSQPWASFRFLASSTTENSISIEYNITNSANFVDWFDTTTQTLTGTYNIVDRVLDTTTPTTVNAYQPEVGQEGMASTPALVFTEEFRSVTADGEIGALVGNNIKVDMSSEYPFSAEVDGTAASSITFTNEKSYSWVAFRTSLTQLDDQVATINNDLDTSFVNAFLFDNASSYPRSVTFNTRGQISKTLADISIGATGYATLMVSPTRNSNWVIELSFDSSSCTAGAATTLTTDSTGVVISYTCSVAGTFAYTFSIKDAAGAEITDAIYFDGYDNLFGSVDVGDSESVITNFPVSNIMAGVGYTFTISLPFAPATSVTVIPVANYLRFSPTAVTFTPGSCAAVVTVTADLAASGENTNVEFVLSGPDAYRYTLPSVTTLNIGTYSAQVYPASGLSVPAGATIPYTVSIDNFPVGYDSVSYGISAYDGFSCTPSVLTLSTGAPRANFTCVATYAGTPSVTLVPYGPAAFWFGTISRSVTTSARNWYLVRREPVLNNPGSVSTLSYGYLSFFAVTVASNPTNPLNSIIDYPPGAVTFTFSNPNLFISPSSVTLDGGNYEQIISVAGLTPGSHTIEVLVSGPAGHYYQFSTSFGSTLTLTSQQYQTNEQASALLGSAGTISMVGLPTLVLLSVLLWVLA